MALSIPPFLTLPTFGAVSIAPPPPNPLTPQDVFDSLAFPFTIWMAGFGLELSDRISTMNLLVSGLNTNTAWMKEAYNQTLALSNHVDARKIQFETLRNETIVARNDTLNTAGYVTGLVNINFATFLQSGNGHISVVVNDLNVSAPSINSNGHFLINII